MAKKNLAIRYTDKTYASIVQSLIDIAKRYYPDTYKDLSKAGVGSLLIDMTAYIGDILSYYVDYGVNESFLDTAVEYNNIIRLARQYGYKFKGAPTSQGYATFFAMIPANTNGLGPNEELVPTLRRGTQLSSQDGVSFILAEDLYFGSSSREVVVGRTDSTTGLPTYYAIKMRGLIISGKLEEEIIEVGAFQKFLRLKMGSSDIAEIISIIDLEGHEYYEVDYLSQDVIYKPILNRDLTTVEQAPNLLRPMAVPRRFTVERERRLTYLQFGCSDETDIEANSVVDPSQVVINAYGKNYVTSVSFDPQKLVSTNKFGIAPANTKLKIIYRLNSSEEVNAASGRLNRIISARVAFDSTYAIGAAVKDSIIGSLEVLNEEPIIGDAALPTAEEIRQRAADSYAMQGRAVHARDYQALIYNMPPKYGSVKRISVIRDPDSFERNINMYIISKDSTGKLIQTNMAVKENVRTWLMQNKSLNDTIDIMDAKVVNYGIEFEALSDEEHSKYDILEAAKSTLQGALSITKNIGEPIFLTELYEILNNVLGVADVIKIKIKPRSGGVYSDYTFNFDNMMTADGRSLKCPANVILELKYPNLDVKGVVR